MIFGYVFFGVQLVSSGDNAVIGGTSLVYAASGLLGYFGIGQAPLAVFSRTNMISVIMGILGIMGLLTGGITMPLMMITLMHLFDVVQGASREDSSLPNSAYENVGSTREQAGPVARFFLDSWKSEAISRSNYTTAQITQMIMMGIQLYLAIISLFGGSASPTLVVPYLVFILASAYSYFSPMRLAGVDALQSNGAQIALLGASTHHIVTAAPGLSFYMLFSILALDALMSCSQFFDEN